MTAPVASRLDVRPSRPGAPLVLDAPTLAAAFAIPLAPPRRLSPAQVEALEMICEGASYRLIAQRLGIAESGARKLMSAAFRILRVRNKAHAVRAGVETGILHLRRLP